MHNDCFYWALMTPRCHDGDCEKIRARCGCLGCTSIQMNHTLCPSRSVHDSRDESQSFPGGPCLRFAPQNDGKTTVHQRNSLNSIQIISIQWAPLDDMCGCSENLLRHTLAIPTIMSPLILVVAACGPMHVNPQPDVRKCQETGVEIKLEFTGKQAFAKKLKVGGQTCGRRPLRSCAMNPSTKVLAIVPGAPPPLTPDHAGPSLCRTCLS